MEADNHHGSWLTGENRISGDVMGDASGVDNCLVGMVAVYGHVEFPESNGRD